MQFEFSWTVGMYRFLYSLQGPNIYPHWDITVCIMGLWVITDITTYYLCRNDDGLEFIVRYLDIFQQLRTYLVFVENSLFLIEYEQTTDLNIGYLPNKPTISFTLWIFSKKKKFGLSKHMAGPPLCISPSLFCIDITHIIRSVALLRHNTKVEHT